MAGVQFEHRRDAEGVPANEKWALKGGWFRGVQVQLAVAADVEQIAAGSLNRQRKLVAIEESIREALGDVKFREEHAGHVEHMALVRERIGAVAAPVCRIRKEVRTVDVVLLWRIVYCVRPGVRRIQLAPSAAAFLKGHVQRVV